MKALIEYYQLENKRRILRRKFLKWVKQVRKSSHDKAIERITKMRWLLSRQEDTPVRQQYLDAVNLVEKLIEEE